MSLNFPNAPAPGQVFTAEGVTFIWNGTVWAAPPNPFPWATAAEGAAGAVTGRVVTPEALDACLDALGPAVPPAIPGPQLMGAARVSGTNYQNLTGKPLFVSVVLGSTSVGSPAVHVGPTNPASMLLGAQTQNGSGWRAAVRFIVPVNWWYRVTNQGGGNIVSWWEYRT